MLRRCQNPADDSYHNYGARGILVCERWGEFEVFLADMGVRPAGMTIDRIDNDGNYEPGNCRWADAWTQCNNTRVNRHVVVGGETLTMAQAADGYGIKNDIVWGRLNRGWSVERALVAVVRPKARNCCIGGVSALAAERGMSAQTLYARLRLGWTRERALSTPVAVRRQGSDRDAAAERKRLSEASAATRAERAERYRVLLASAAERGVLITVDALRGRLKLGWSEERAVSTPVHYYHLAPKPGALVEQMVLGI